MVAGDVGPGSPVYLCDDNPTGQSVIIENTELCDTPAGRVLYVQPGAFLDDQVAACVHLHGTGKGLDGVGAGDVHMVSVYIRPGLAVHFCDNNPAGQRIVIKHAELRNAPANRVLYV